MSQAPRHRRPWAAAATAFAIALAAFGIVALATLGLGLRDDATRTADALRTETARLAATVDGATPVAARRALGSSSVAARIVGPKGNVRADGAMSALWAGAGAPFPARVAAWGADATLGHGFVEETAALADGTHLVTRAPLAMGPAGILSGGWPLLAFLVVAAAAVAGAVWRRESRLAARLRGIAGEVDALAGGRPVRFARGARGEWGTLDAALGRASHRMIELQGAAAVRMDALGVALAPLALPVVARTPSGGIVRNDAVERLVAELPPADRDAVEETLRTGLTGTGSSSRRLELTDGRVLEADTWAVPGGRLVALSERTEQTRLARLRAALTGSAVRGLRGPLQAIRARSAEVLARTPADSAAPVREIAASADRLDRIVGRLLRGADGQDRPVRTRPVSVQSIAFALGQGHDARLRERGLRLEHDIADDLPALDVDPGLVHEILTELLDNASAATPRGGVVTLRARPGAPGMVRLAVTDTGAGIPGHERALVMEPFGRGQGASIRPGAGLGLGVARELAHRMGGHIRIEAGPGGVALVELPAAAPAEPSPSEDGEDRVLTGASAGTP